MVFLRFEEVVGNGKSKTAGVAIVTLGGAPKCRQVLVEIGVCRPHFSGPGSCRSKSLDFRAAV